MHLMHSRVHQSQPLQGRRHLTDQEESVKERDRQRQWPFVPRASIFRSLALSQDGW